MVCLLLIMLKMKLFNKEALVLSLTMNIFFVYTFILNIQLHHLGKRHKGK